MEDEIICDIAAEIWLNVQYREQKNVVYAETDTIASTNAKVFQRFSELEEEITLQQGHKKPLGGKSFIL